LIKVWIQNVYDRPTPKARGMVMPAHPSVEPHRHTRMVELSHDAHRCQRFQNAINGGQRQFGHFGAKIFIKLICRRVIFAPQKGLQN